MKVVRRSITSVFMSSSSSSLCFLGDVGAGDLRICSRTGTTLFWIEPLHSGMSASVISTSFTCLDLFL